MSIICYLNSEPYKKTDLSNIDNSRRLIENLQDYNPTHWLLYNSKDTFLVIFLQHKCLLKVIYLHYLRQCIECHSLQDVICIFFSNKSPYWFLCDSNWRKYHYFVFDHGHLWNYVSVHRNKSWKSVLNRVSERKNVISIHELYLCARLQVSKNGGISVDRPNKKGYRFCMFSKYSR